MTLTLRSGKGSPLSATDHDSNMLRLGGFPSLASMLADTARGYGVYEPGQTVITLAEGFRYKVAASDAEDHHLTTAAGLKLHVLPGDDGVYNFRAFNPAANGTTDDYARLRLALDTLVWGEAPHKRGPAIYFPDPAYRFNQAIELNTVVHFIGNHTGKIGTVFNFPEDVSGIVVNHFNTGNGTAISEAEAISLGLSGAGGSVFDGIQCRGKPFPAERGNANGLWLRAPAKIIDCYFNDFNGCGMLIDAWDPADMPENPERWGDARGWYMLRTGATYSGRNGLRVRGTRSSGGMCIKGDFVSTGLYALDDHAPGQNLYLACHSATNGNGTGAGNFTEPRKSSVIRYEGSLYQAIFKLEQMDSEGDPSAEYLEALVDTVPGTDNDIWTYRGAADGPASWWPTWVPDQDPGHYFPGGGYKLSHPDSTSQNLGSYAEDDDGSGHVYNGRQSVLSGIQNNLNVGSKPHIENGGDFAVLGAGSVSAGFGSTSVTLRADDFEDPRVILTAGDEVWSFMRWEGEDLVIDCEGADTVPVAFTGPATSETFGTSAAVRYRMAMPIIGIGEGEDARRHTRMAAAPTTGEWAQGDLVWNLDPSAGGNAAWTCVEGGTPGTWKTCLPIEE